MTITAAAVGSEDLGVVSAERPLGDLRQALEVAREQRSEDVPLGDDEAVLRRSDAPHYTAFASPLLPSWLAERSNNREEPTRGPFVDHVRTDVRHPVYSFHPYHTKVPPSVIAQLIRHYTEPGDVVLDVFSGSGMTGVAARDERRHAVLVDLSPAATFISAVNTRAHAWPLAGEALHRVLDESEAQYGWVYLTAEGKPANYFVWCDVFTCPDCASEFPFFPHGVNHTGTKVETLDAFPCPACATKLNVRRVRRVIRDGQKHKELVWVNAGTGSERVNRASTEADQDLAARVAAAPCPPFPTTPIKPTGYSAKLAQLGDKAITDVSRLLSDRNRLVFADLWQRLERVADPAVRNLCLATLTSIFTVVSERQGYFGGGGGMSGNLYMPIVRMEKNVYETLRRKMSKLIAAEKAKQHLSSDVLVTTQSATRLDNIPSSSIDYIYTDPPFGANIIYNEVNLALESWLGVYTNTTDEAVVDETIEKSLSDYRDLLNGSFAECHRVLKPGRWMTVEFHNTAAEVWDAIQGAITGAGFEILAVSTLDKGTTTILGDIRPNSAKHDLLISAVKRTDVRTGQVRNGAPLHELVPVIESIISAVPEASRRELKHHVFSRLVAHHLERGLRVTFSTQQLYEFVEPHIRRLRPSATELLPAPGSGERGNETLF